MSVFLPLNSRPTGRVCTGMFSRGGRVFGPRIIVMEVLEMLG